jgi:hypothetical protein
LVETRGREREREREAILICGINKTLRGSTISWEPCFMKQRFLIQIFYFFIFFIIVQISSSPFDLSSATDRFPLVIQGVRIENCLFNKLTSFEWVAPPLGAKTCKKKKKKNGIGECF